jgi:hypothetical protein
MTRDLQTELTLNDRREIEPRVRLLSAGNKSFCARRLIHTDTPKLRLQARTLLLAVPVFI